MFQIHARWQHRLSQTASICLQEFVSLLYHYCKRWARACTVLHLSRRLTRGDRRLGSAPLHSGPFIHGSLISQSLCFNSEDEKCLYVPYLHCFCSDLLYSFNVLVSLIIAILKLLAVLSTLNNGELFIESARLARKAAYFRSLSCTTAFLKYLWYQVNFHKYLLFGNSTAKHFIVHATKSKQCFCINT